MEASISSKVRYDTTLVDELQAKQDFKTIINNENLFWITYCKICSFIPEACSDKGNCREPFIPILEGKCILLESEKCMEYTKKIVELTRKFFVDGIGNNTNFDIFVFSNVVNSEFFKENKLDKTLTKQGTSFGKFDYERFKFALPELAKACGAIYTITQQQRFYKDQLLARDSGIKTCDVLQIQWDSNRHHVSPIPLKEIPSEVSLGSALYPSYQQKRLCDCALISKDGQNSFMVHAVILDINGGPFFQSLFNGSMRESQKKEIVFPEHSTSTILAFIDFVYLGGKDFEAQTLSKGCKFDLCELLDFAYTYQVEILKDCCTNLLCLFSTKEDAVNIKCLAERYSNENLKKLSASLDAEY